MKTAIRRIKRLPPETPDLKYPDPVIILTDEQFETIKALTEEVLSYGRIKLGSTSTKEDMEETKSYSHSGNQLKFRIKASAVRFLEDEGDITIYKDANKCRIAWYNYHRSKKDFYIKVRFTVAELQKYVQSDIYIKNDVWSLVNPSTEKNVL